VNGETQIHDIGYEVIPYTDIPNIYRRILEYGWVPFAVLSKQSERVMSEIILGVAAVLMIRFVSMTMTILPSPLPLEKNTKFQIEKLSGGGVYDKVFSGHTALATVVTLVLIRYGIWNTSGYIYPVIMGLYMISTRGHYTVDVFLGFTIAYLVHSVLFKC